MAAHLSDEQIIQAFHRFCVDALAQARAEGLLDDGDLERADVDVQVAGPALALFFAALSASGSPPSITSPDGSFALTTSNCPDTFRNAFTLWQRTVEPIQRFPITARHDLALLCCDKEVRSSPLRLDVAKVAADLKGIALEILQRRTFQTRFRNDLQAALDTSVRPRTSADGDQPSRVAYEPPPMYFEGAPTSETKRAHEQLAFHGATEGNEDAAAQAQGIENLSLIRETLYAALGDVMVETPSILGMLARGADWAPQAFFASTALAILDVALRRVDDNGVRPVHFGHGSPRYIGLGDTPPYLRPLLGGLVELSQASRALQEEDDARAVREATEGVEQLTPPRLDQLKDRLAQGVGATFGDDEQVAALANAINQLALGMTSLPAFRERQAQALQVLVAVTAM
ncbi:hypothetical protein DMC30DRAFT_417543 [Rhodotorula diobovata]|uniref:Uncharacterized protein n=1 Tax=Rhodotorula diobovata TaxID=5288 RepID=A0A5C5FT40_9BASI|nr:hypothetical protein DMC30DRAFT_417543 [Rhodotorula diobovata]